ncbi:septation protein SepH, partial [Bifidobacterium adolescentis]
MPENALEDARFDHVSETGELVFVSGAGKFAVKVDEALERAILEAKQIRTETQEERQQQAPSTLPISQIQSLIRAGANPTRVAERYSLSEALVRRFSAAVETEKQYAIEQFLAVPAPKESRVRTLSELIERTFAAAHVRLEDVRWKATRRGLEPWKITAEFDSAGHAARAEWSWNMHDNAVNCLNATARKLIGEQDTPTEGHAEKQVDQNFLASLNLPGDSARSARIEQTVSAWNAPEPVAPQAT